MSHRDPTQIRVGGYWLGLEMTCSPPTVVTTWGVDGAPGPSGTYEISWGVDLPQGSRHPALRRSALVEVVDGGVVVESGLMLRPNWRTGEMTAVGLARQASGFAAENGTGDMGTSIANAAVDHMIARATTHTTRPVNLLATAAGENSNTDALPYVEDVLNTAARIQDRRWGVTPDGRWFFADDPTEPTWVLAPGVADLEFAGDGYAPTVKVRYLSQEAYDLALADAEDAVAGMTTPLPGTTAGGPPLTVSGTASPSGDSVSGSTSAQGAQSVTVDQPVEPDPVPRSAYVKTYTTTDQDAERYWGPGEYLVDARDLGKIPDARAAQLGNSIRRKSSARLRWVGSVDVNAEQLATAGGVQASLRAVRAGHMLRIPLGFSDYTDVTGRLWLDVVIGRTEHTYGTTTIRLEPVDAAPRTPMQVAERLLRRMDKQIKREQKLLKQ